MKQYIIYANYNGSDNNHTWLVKANNSSEAIEKLLVSLKEDYTAEFVEDVKRKISVDVIDEKVEIIKIA